MHALVAVVIVLLVFVLVMVGVSVLVTVSVARRVHRSARSRVDSLRLKAAALPGRPGREVASLRVRLRESLSQTQAVVGSPSFTGSPECREMGALLHQATGAIDRQLALLEREPDSALRQRYLAIVTPRAVKVIEDAAALRDAVYALGLQLGQGGLGGPLGPGYGGYDPRADLRDRIDGLRIAVRELSRAGVDPHTF